MTLTATSRTELPGQPRAVVSIQYRRTEKTSEPQAIRVLVVAGDNDAAEGRAHDLRRQGYCTRLVSTGAEVLRTHEHSDMILLDLDLPDIDGLEVCRSIRASGDKPIITLTGRDTELDRVLALQAGADDCVVRSCGPREMTARIEAVLRRAHPRPAPVRILSIGPLHVDERTREVRLHGKRVSLTAKEFELLHILASNPGNVMSRKDLMARVWDTDWVDSSRTIDTHVRNLRAKLGASTWVITVRGVGYRIGHG